MEENDKRKREMGVVCIWVAGEVQGTISSGFKETILGGLSTPLNHSSELSLGHSQSTVSTKISSWKSSP
jgi:hypothetical protein